MSVSAIRQPAGFERHFRTSPVTDPWEPLWSKREGVRFIIAFTAAPAHCNSRGLLHGGVISALADNAMGLACSFAVGGDVRLLTVHLSVDFTGLAAVGAWVEVTATPTKVGRSLCFADAVITADGVSVARGSTVFKASKPKAA